MQDYVGKYFFQAGYEVWTPKTVETVRGKVEVDVYVRAKEELGDVIICECKFWDSRVPQDKIYAFRNVVSDLGAHVGLFISKAGFQKGAYAVAKLSNIKLLTWEQFVSLIEDKWIKERVKRIIKLRRPLAVLMDPLDVPMEKLKKEQIEAYYRLFEEYKYAYIFASELWVESFSGIDSTEVDNKIQEAIAKINTKSKNSIISLEELFDELESILVEATIAYQNIFRQFLDEITCKY